ncbi:hypothetical protein, partial [Mixta calida]|uniref:hypothetical protein n=1 Tax=Mixta calida TaxID=665913 RepID=UPI0028ADE8E7
TTQRASVFIKFRCDDVINHVGVCLSAYSGKRALCKVTGQKQALAKFRFTPRNVYAGMPA